MPSMSRRPVIASLLWICVVGCGPATGGDPEYWTPAPGNVGIGGDGGAGGDTLGRLAPGIGGGTTARAPEPGGDVFRLGGGAVPGRSVFLVIPSPRR